MAARFAVSLSQSPAISAGGGQRHPRIELAFHPQAVLAARAFGQVMSPPSQNESAQQQRLHAWGEDGVAGLDGELTVAQLVRQADLPVRGMPLLG